MACTNLSYINYCNLIYIFKFCKGLLGVYYHRNYCKNIYKLDNHLGGKMINLLYLWLGDDWFQEKKKKNQGLQVDY